MRIRGWFFVATITGFLGWALLSFADQCATPCRTENDLEGVRCGTDCVYVSVEETERLAGRWCFDWSPSCRTHSAGDCNHQVDVFCRVKKYKCLHADGTLCRSGTQTRELGPRRTQPTFLDCQGHRCRGPGSFITPAPAPSPTSK